MILLILVIWLVYSFLFLNAGQRAEFDALTIISMTAIILVILARRIKAIADRKFWGFVKDMADSI